MLFVSIKMKRRTVDEKEMVEKVKRRLINNKDFSKDIAETEKLSGYQFPNLSKESM